MTREQAIKLESNPIWQAFKRGEQIEFQSPDNDQWLPIGNDFGVEFLLANPDRYRIAVVDSPIIYVNIYPLGQWSAWPNEALAKANRTSDCIRTEKYGPIN